MFYDSSSDDDDQGNEYLKFVGEIAPFYNGPPLNRTMGRHGEEAQKKSLHTSAFNTKLKEFYEEYNTKKHIDKKIISTSPLFSESIIIGEITHSDIAPKKFLIENMNTLKELGYKTIYFEHLYYEDQENIDELAIKWDKENPIAKRLETFDFGFQSNHALKFWNKYNFTAVVKAAFESGIRVVAIDTEQTYKTQKTDRTRSNDDDTARRLSYMNYTATKIISHHQEKNNDKFILLCGSAHVQKMLDVPGVAELIGTRSLHLGDTNKDSVIYDSKLDILNHKIKADKILLVNLADSIKISSDNNIEVKSKNIHSPTLFMKNSMIEVGSNKTGNSETLQQTPKLQ